MLWACALLILYKYSSKVENPVDLHNFFFAKFNQVSLFCADSIKQRKCYYKHSVGNFQKSQFFKTLNLYKI